jgi:hypothetical protein
MQPASSLHQGVPQRYFTIPGNTTCNSRCLMDSHSGSKVSASLPQRSADDRFAKATAAPGQARWLPCSTTQSQRSVGDPTMGLPTTHSYIDQQIAAPQPTVLWPANQSSCCTVLHLVHCTAAWLVHHHTWTAASCPETHISNGSLRQTVPDSHLHSISNPGLCAWRLI